MLNRLRLTSVEATAPRRGEAGDVLDVYFFLRTEDAEGREGVYRLRAVSGGDDYEAIYTGFTEGDEVPEHQEELPLVVPPSIVAAEGLVDHVKRRFLDPRNPDGINWVRPLLVGPLEGEGSGVA